MVGLDGLVYAMPLTVHSSNGLLRTVLRSLQCEALDPWAAQSSVQCMQAPMLAGEMENMFAAPVSNGQWAGQQGGSSTLPAQLKAEQAAPEQEAAQTAGSQHC